jgi:hypothetical protein
MLPRFGRSKFHAGMRSLAREKVVGDITTVLAEVRPADGIAAMEIEMCDCEPTLDELLADPMMEPVLQQSGTDARQLRDLLAQAVARRAQGKSPAAAE